MVGEGLAAAETGWAPFPVAVVAVESPVEVVCDGGGTVEGPAVAPVVVEPVPGKGAPDVEPVTEAGPVDVAVRLGVDTTVTVVSPLGMLWA